MYSSHTIIGYLGHEPELRYTPSQLPVTTLKIGTSSSRKDPDTGEWVDKTTWHRCVFAGKQAESVCNKAFKGIQMLVEGTPEDRSWKTKGGEKITVREIKAHVVKFPAGFKAKPSADESSQREAFSAKQTGDSAKQTGDNDGWWDDYDRAKTL